MKKNQDTLLSAIFIIGVIGWIFFAMMPQWVSKDDEPLSEFSTKRALQHVAEMAAKPHYVGSANHDAVAIYVEKELQKLGLETSIQEGTTLTEWGNLAKSKNIMARIDGTANSKALLLLSHYDSAPHSYSHGASDDASGVATILESIRVFLHNKTPHKNDIIILFTDAEELGLNGAALFVTKNGWAKDVGVALNFEARGSSGPAYMFMEVNQGNAEMVKEFTAANPKYPVANSLMYSIYKMLPNDTDLTVFRQQGKIQGFNFAYIDSHFNYHTAQDDIDHLDHTSLAHQGSYLMPLLGYLSNADLGSLTTTEDDVYFSTPFNFISYPFSWIYPMLIVAIVLFLFFVFIGIGKRALVIKEIGKGFLNLFGALIVAGLVGYFGWKCLLVIYPQYNDILQGFTYNGHSYMFSFIFMSLGIAFLFYRKKVAENIVMSYSIAPLFLWILINLAVAIWLPGAAFFVIPVFCALLMLAWFVLTQKTNTFFNVIFCIPSLILLVPFIWMFPIGLGLKILFGSVILTILVFGLLLPIFGSFNKKGFWAFGMFLLSIGFFVNAHLQSDYNNGKAKPNSLVYIYDADKDKASWATYDVNPDEWTKKYLGDNPNNANQLNTIPLFSKYATKFTFSTDAPIKPLAQPTIEFLMDSVMGNQRYLKIKISPNRTVNRYDISANENLAIYNLKANGASHINQKGSLYKRNSERILSYYVVNNEPLELQFSINKNAILDMELLESSFDLVTNPAFGMAKRKPLMMPMPFVLNDAVIIMQKIRASPRAEKPLVPVPVTMPATETPTQTMDTIQDASTEN
ncbi:MAG TPA: M28 family peptidase [Flavobacterium sp.]|nr:M28 family peptidase [Flavobacterium sp.]